MTFIEKAKRFFEPVREAPILYFKSLTEGCIDGLYLVSSLYFFEKIGNSIYEGDMEKFYGLLWIYAIVLGIYFLFKYFALHWGWVHLYVQIERHITEKYLTRFIQAEPNIVEKIGTGKFIAMHKKASHVWLDAIHGFLSTDLALVVVSVYGLIRISQFNPLYGFCVIASLIVVLITTYYLDRHYTIPSRRVRIHAEGEYGRLLARIFMSKNEYLQGNQFGKDKKEIHQLLENIRNSNIIIEYIVGGMFIAIRIIGVLLRLFVYIFIGKELFENGADFWTFSMYIMIVGIIETNLRTFYDTFRKFTREFHHLEHFWSTFDSLTPIKGYDSGLPFSPQGKNLEIQNITYGYNETKVFENFSLTLEKGKKTALVGASGGGKTTLMKLIAGYLHPESGSISVMGNNLSETALKTYYPHIGYLTQEPGVFDATIRENLVSAISTSNQKTEDRNQNGIDKNKKTKENQIRNHSADGLLQTDNSIELERALRLAQCDFVFDLEHGLDTEIGERGVRLSGGQKQRLAIAKIFLKDPEIILLDEPTSALDSFSEEKITEALNTLFEGRTVIIVAHRLQTVKRADDIIVIEGGEVVERGTHDTLVKKGGIYNKMLELQSGF